ncbi:MAG: D-glycero-alpha-D-manno-heptose-1,7-bisphosphate 7-phosphatase [Limisphaerales bacterium]
MRAVFLDRDGTLILEKSYLGDPAGVELCPGALEGVARLRKAGWVLFVVTNQSGIGRGYYSEDDMHSVNARMVHLLGGDAEDSIFRKIYFAPEAPGEPGRGRKPSPQFLLDAREEFGVNLAESLMVGDKRIDLECGWNAGVRLSVLVRTGYGARLVEEQPELGKRALVVENLAELAAQLA